MQFLVDDGQPFTVTMDAERSVGGDRNLYLGWDWSGPDAVRLRNGGTLYIRLWTEERRFDGEFDIRDFLKTPVQPNLEHCGR